MQRTVPTIDELRAALSACHIVAGIPGAHAEAIEHLRNLRNQKYSWLFYDENCVRFEIDSYLRAQT